MLRMHFTQHHDQRSPEDPTESREDAWTDTARFNRRYSPNYSAQNRAPRTQRGRTQPTSEHLCEKLKRSRSGHERRPVCPNDHFIAGDKGCSSDSITDSDRDGLLPFSAAIGFVVGIAVACAEQ